MPELSEEILPYVPFLKTENNIFFITENNERLIVDNIDTNYPSRGRVGAYKIQDNRVVVDVNDAAMVARYNLTEQQ